MPPLQDLLHRIKWDAEFAKAEFAIGYYDRIAQGEKVVRLGSIDIDAGGDSFSVQNEEGTVVHIPLHRVRTVYKSGAVIWQRPGHTGD